MSGCRNTRNAGMPTIAPSLKIVDACSRASSSFSNRYATSSAVAIFASSAGWNWKYLPTRIHERTLAIRSPNVSR